MVPSKKTNGCVTVDAVKPKNGGFPHIESEPQMSFCTYLKYDWVMLRFKAPRRNSTFQGYGQDYYDHLACLQVDKIIKQNFTGKE